MKHFLLYGHGGAYNHGSEASVKCDIDLLRKISPDCRITLSSHFPEQDIELGIDADEIIGRNIDGSTFEDVYADTINAITADTICLSVGGDIYCYLNWQRYASIHNAAKKIGAKSILWSCSVEPSMVDEEMLEVFRTHDSIFLRESISYNVLKEFGLKNIYKMPDIAFSLKPKETKIPCSNYVVLNLSPLVIRKNQNVLYAYQKLVDYIINDTDMNIVLLPHVEVSVDNDADALNLLTGDESRIFRIPTGLCAAEYKYIISKANFCVASRTHVTIAAWSSLVPTIAVGYSSKARGIAKDLEQEKFVIDVNDINNVILIEYFQKLTSEMKFIFEELRKKIINHNKFINFDKIQSLF